jgi:cytidylate kinase
VAKGVASRLGLRYLDTGAMYRALTWWMLEHAVDVNDSEAVAARAYEAVVTSGTDPTNPTIIVDETDVAVAIRGAAVTGAVSAVSAVPQVRARMVALQRDIIRGGGIVVEGRDIGAVVAPDADVKIYLTADPAARAERRSLELQHDPTVTMEATLDDLHRRDRIDSTRAASPLTRADDAVVVDATSLGLDEVIARVTELVLDRTGVT